MTTADDKAHCRVDVAPGEHPAGVQVGFNVVHRDQGHVVSQADGLGSGESDQEASHEAGLCDHRHSCDVLQCHASFDESPVEDRQDIGQVGPRGDLGNNATEFGVEFNLRSNDVGTDGQAAVNHRSGRLVTTRFDRQQELVRFSGGGLHGRGH